MSKQIDLERLEAAAREQWTQDSELRADFCGDFDTYLAYRKATALGLVRVIGQGSGGPAA